MDVDQLIDDYLETQRVVLWGQFFDIQSKEGRKKAKNFILDLLIDLNMTNEMIEDE